jgi:hypothetical protein
MSEWWKYENETPIDINTIKVGEKYFYLPGMGLKTGIVTILSDEPQNGILVEYTDVKDPTSNKNKQDVILLTEPNKKLYKLLSGGKKSRRNRKNKTTKTRKAKRTRKNKRKTNRRR